jgi:fibronectin type 3 domain-containing protein
VALSWSAPSGATSYNVQRSTTNGGPYTSIATPTTTSYTDTGVTNGTTYYYVVAAVNGAGQSANSSQVSATPQQTISFVQAMASASSGSAQSLSLSFSQNTLAGDLILVAFDYDTKSAPSSVTDSQGNVFTAVGSQLTSPGGARSRVYYATSITGGTDTVKVNLSANSAWIELYLTEYSGASQTNPIDTQQGASGNAGSVSSGNGTTTVAGDLIFGYCVADDTCNAGPGFTARSTFHSNLIENMLAGNPGSYAATGSANNGWTMQMLAIKPAVVTNPPPAPTNLVATAGNQQVALSWSASSGATSYNVQRSTTNGGPYTSIATPTTTSYTDTSVTNGTT